MTVSTRLPFTLATSALAIALALPATAQESTDPIRLTLHNWAGN